MKKISIYNSFVGKNDSKREFMKNKLKSNGFTTGGHGDFLLVIGGDGTFLSAIRKRFQENPVFVGFNTGNLGFLSEFTLDKLDDFIKILKTKDYWIEEIPVYQVFIKEPNNERVEYFVNDLTVERKSTRILHMSVHLNNEEICTVSADGLIISTALGSTGYGRSAGGSIILDANNILELTPISPIQSRAYQSLDSPIIFNDTNEVTIFPNYKKQRTFRVVCDGKEINTENVRFIDVKKTNKTVRILRTKKYDPKQNIKHKILNIE